MRLAALALVALLAACSTDPAVEGPYYTQGFTDGCRTAEARQAAFDTRRFRDETLFETQESYRSGWRAGYAECQPPAPLGVQPTPEGSTDPIL